MIDYLTKAKNFTQKAEEKELLTLYINFFLTGNIEYHKEAQKKWLENNSAIIDYNMGWLETMIDPLGVRGVFESFVGLIDTFMSQRYEQLINLLPDLMLELPWKNEFNEISNNINIKAFEVTCFARKGCPYGKSLPNYSDIRKTLGMKDLLFSNVMPNFKEMEDNLFYYNSKEKELINNFGQTSIKITTCIRLIIGYGVSKFFKCEKYVKKVEANEIHENQEIHEKQENNQKQESQEIQENKEINENKEKQESQEIRENQEIRDNQENPENKENQDNHENKENQENKEKKEKLEEKIIIEEIYNFEKTLINPLTGKEIEEWYKDDETFEKKFGNYSTLVNDLISLLMGLYFCGNENIQEIFYINKIDFKNVTYTCWMLFLSNAIQDLNLYNAKEKIWNYGPSQCAWIIINYILSEQKESEEIIKFEPDKDKTIFKIILNKEYLTDNVNEIIAKLLQNIYISKCIGNVDNVTKIIEKYSVLDKESVLDVKEIIDKDKENKTFFLFHNLKEDKEKDKITYVDYSINLEGVIQSYLDRYDEQINKDIYNQWVKYATNFIKS